MSLEEELVRSIHDFSKQGENLKYIAIDLALRSAEYDPKTLARTAREAKEQQRLGFLADVTLQGLHQHAQPENPVYTSACTQLDELIRHLDGTHQNWQYLNPYTGPIFSKLNQAPRSIKESNKRWRIWARLTPDEMADWVDLYITGKHLQYHG